MNGREGRTRGNKTRGHGDAETRRKGEERLISAECVVLGGEGERLKRGNGDTGENQYGGVGVRGYGGKGSCV